MRSAIRVTLVLAMSLLAALGDAQTERRRIAVLEFTNEAGLREKEAEQLADDVRGAALVLPKDRYLVMTRESILVLLPPGRTFQECTQGQCEVETGRLVGADLVVAGTVRRFAGDYVLTLKVFDTHSGALQGQAECEAPDLKRLRQEVKAKSKDLFRAMWSGPGSPGPGPGMPPPPPPPGGAAIEWVTIPGGTFMMGSYGRELVGSERSYIVIENGRQVIEKKSGPEEDEQPVHRVTVRTFQIARTEVTVAQYRACVEAGACTPAHSDDGTCWVFDPDAQWWAQGVLPSRFRGDDQPVVCVDRDQAVAFSRWVGGRLPTEAEWEYAARSGGKDRVYPWGDEKATCERAVMYDESRGYGCGLKSTWPVCSKPGGNTVQGLCDMAGNVWEWVQDGYHDSYDGAPSDGSAWESPAGSVRVLRGGGWHHLADFARAAVRDFGDPGIRSGYLGFRPARSSP